MDLISIIITTYNGIDSLQQCVDSAMSQDYPNFEVIVVDDNGLNTEMQIQTQKLVETYRGRKNFKYIAHEKNRNGSAARNTGIINSQGSYIAFLDDDDIMHKDSIKLRYEKLSKMTDDYGIVFASFSQYIGKVKDKDCIYEFDGNIMCEYLQQKKDSPSSVIMIKRNVIDNVGLWDESFYRHQDWEFITRILSKYKACAVNIISIDRIVTWRNNAKMPEVFEAQRLYFLEKMKEYIELLNEKDKQEVYYKHYIDIGKNFLKNMDLFAAYKYAKKSANIARAFSEYFTSTISYIIKKISRKF